MKYFQFLIFISALVFTFSHVCSYMYSDNMEGIEVWELRSYEEPIRKIEDINLQSIKFFPQYSYIVLHTEFLKYESTNNNNNNKKETKKWAICCTSSSVEEVEEIYYGYNIYYMITYKKYTLVSEKVTDAVAELLNHIEERTKHKLITVIREDHDRKSNEFLMLFPHISDQTKWERKAWSEIFAEKPSFSLFSLTTPSTIKRINKLNPWDAFVVDFGTDLIAITTSNEILVGLTQNVINFVKRCRSTEVNIHTVEHYTDLGISLEAIYLRINLRPINTRPIRCLKKFVLYNVHEKYELFEYEALSDSSYKKIIFDEFWTYELTSRLIMKNKNYVLIDLVFEIIFIFITTNDTNDIKHMLKSAELIHNYSRRFKVSVAQPHKLNLPFILSFEDVKQDVLKNNITNRVRKFITVCEN